MKDKEAFDARIKDGIEKYRKGYCKLKIVDKNGKPLANQQVTIDQQTHDFGFGANIFMLDELENDDDNLKYRESFKKYFNLATVKTALRYGGVRHLIAALNTARKTVLRRSCTVLFTKISYPIGFPLAT